MEDKDIEELEKLKDCFKKTANILDEIINISKEVDNTQDKKKIKELNKKAEEQFDLFTLQMIKISKFSK